MTKQQNRWTACRVGHAAYVARMREKRIAAAKRWTSHLQAQQEISSVSEILDLYLDSHFTPDARSVIDNWIRPAFGDLRPSSVGPVEIEAWILAMRSDAASEGAPLPSNTERTRYSRLAAVFRWAHREKLISQNNAQLPAGVLQPRRPRIGFDPAAELPSIAEVVRILTSREIPLERRVDYALAACDGLRSGERYDLCVGEIDLERLPLPAINIDSSWNRKLGKSTPTKSRIARVIPAHGGTAARLLRAWIERGWKEAHGRDPLPGDLLLPRVAPGGELVPRNDRQALKRWHKDLAILGLAPRRLHALRHWFVTTLIHAGADWRAVERLTHPSPRWRTAEGYVHTSFEWLCATISKLPIAIEEPFT